MTTTKSAVKWAPTAVPIVPIVQKSIFSLKKRPVIAPVGLQNATYMGMLNEIPQDPEASDEFNRGVLTVDLDKTDPKGVHFALTKTYNLLPNGRGPRSFLEDYNSWTGAGLVENDLFDDFDGMKDKGQKLVVKVGHRKIGSEWEAYIVSFHPPDFTEPEGEV